ncbi:AAA family ATPase [Kitasatospora sp. NPDC096204]|uniref:helix-turn-helix transcriptional regulator n=1 Tax=Kitasatospora sp. NPDC096204 TaxID=3364094 RepID=UPI0037F44BD8
MQQTSVSPVFVGRGSEITELTDALRRAGTGSPQAVLVGGEAGVGKTRLLEEFLERAAAQGAVTTLGSCLEVGAEGLPYAPLAAALRRLHRSFGPELEAAAAGSESHLALLLSELGEVDGEPNDEYSRARLFEHTARLFERLGAERTLVLAVEDLHWADRSTRELLAFLVRTLHRSRVLLVATYRTDDLHRRHPLRPFLAELERLRTVQRLELARFGRREVAAQLAGILGTAAPDRQLVDRIHRRSEGNPFFVEELATAFEDGFGAGLTDSLRDILLVRVEGLDEEAQRVVRIAAEGGSHVEHALLAAVLDDEEALIEALRVAVGANILRPDSEGEGYRFRHALVREAVSDDLLPGERHRINRKFALAVEAQPQLVPGDALAARLANYWYHAHDPARALPTALDAARAARRRNAFAEQLGMLERALELWDLVSEEVLAHTRPYDWAETYPPGSRDHDAADEDCDRIQLEDVLAEAVVAARRSGDRERGLSLAKRGIRLVDEVEHPVRAAWFRINRARMLGSLRRSGDEEEIAHAHRLVEHLPPSAVQAEVFALSANSAMLKTPGPEHVELAERAIRIAQEVGAHSVEVHARMTLGGLRYDVQGDAEGGLAELAGAVERARLLGVPDLLLRGINNLASMQRGLGRPEAAVRLAREGLEFADGNGLLRNIGAILTGNLVEALTDLGRVREATEVLAGYESTSLTGTHAEFLDRMRGDLAVLAGDLATAATMLAQARAANRIGQVQHSVPISRLAIRIAALGGRPLEARDELLAALVEDGRTGNESDVYPLLAEAAAVEADSRGLPQAEAGRPGALAAIAGAAAELRPRAPLHHGWARLLEAELARAEGTDTPREWAAAVEALRPTGLPYPLALALLRAGEAEVQAGRREAGAELLREAAELAAVRDDRPLGGQIAALAERAGLSLAPAERAAAVPAQAAGDSFNLTPRERDVLRLLARGWTNRQIAEELYISPKTASVHVSNILGKLAVGGRGEAAALAHRLRLFPDDLAPSGR